MNADALLEGSIEEIRERLQAIDGSAEEELLQRVDAIVRDPQRAEVVRSEAAMALGRCNTAWCRQTLHELLLCDDPVLRQLSAGGLGANTDVDSIPWLIDALTDDVNKVRNVAERSLLNRMTQLREVGVPQLIQLLSHPVPLTRSPAARLLGQTQDERAFEPLLANLKSEDWLDRMWASKALGDLGQSAAVAPLSQVLKSDPKNRVRAFAAEALKALRPDNIEQLLNETISDDEDEGVRKAAQEALLSLGFESSDTEFDPFAD